MEKQETETDTETDGGNGNTQAHSAVLCSCVYIAYYISMPWSAYDVREHTQQVVCDGWVESSCQDVK